MARLMRRFAAGAMTNREFERAAEAIADRCQSDPAPECVLWEFVWHFYCDFAEHTLRGERALSREERREWARAVLFLMTDEEYRWPAHGTARLPWWVTLVLLTAADVWAVLIVWLAVGVVVPVPVMSLCFLGLRCAGLVRRRRVALPSRPASPEARGIWPFGDAGAYLAALCRPVFLSGCARHGQAGHDASRVCVR